MNLSPRRFSSPTSAIPPTATAVWWPTSHGTAAARYCAAAAMDTATTSV